MEKYGCNRVEEIEGRIKEIERRNFKTAEESTELKDLKEAKKEILEEQHGQREY
jgi:hypothetical protein